MRVVRKLALGLFLAGALTCVAISAQPQVAQNQPNPAGTGNFWFAQPLSSQSNTYQLQSDSAQLARKYVEAKKEDEKRDIRKQLTEVLNRQFDQHVQQQQHELEELEKQIAKLKEVVRKRLDAKSTIVDRRIEQLIQDAEGLGWNAPSGPHPDLLRNSGFVPLYTAPAAKK
jgi:hypothetical protein